MKNMTTAKKLLILFGGILLIFGSINLIWFVGIKYKYISKSEGMQTADELGKTSAKNTYYLIEDGYEYKIAHPGYLGNNGFLTVSKEGGYKATINEKGEIIADNGVCVSLFIWPEMFGYEYGIDIYSEKEKIAYQLIIDGSGKYIPENKDNVELNESCETILRDYEEEINNLLELANKKWELK